MRPYAAMYEIDRKEGNLAVLRGEEGSELFGAFSRFPEATAVGSRLLVPRDERGELDWLDARLVVD